MIELLSFIGGAAVIGWALVGAYVWLRWGWAGVTVIWRDRARIEAEARREFETVIRGEE